MLSTTIVLALAGLAAAVPQHPGSSRTGDLGDAPVVTDNPVGATYIATLPANKKIQGTVVASTEDSGTGVRFTLNLHDLPKTGGPFRTSPFCYGVIHSLN